MVLNIQVISDLTSFYKDDPDSGIAKADERLASLMDVIESNQLIFSAIEENQFRWADTGRTKADWFQIWTKVKKNLEDCKLGKTPRKGGVFVQRFNKIPL